MRRRWSRPSRGRAGRPRTRGPSRCRDGRGAPAGAGRPGCAARAACRERRPAGPGSSRAVRAARSPSGARRILARDRQRGRPGNVTINRRSRPAEPGYAQPVESGAHRAPRARDRPTQARQGVQLLRPRDGRGDHRRRAPRPDRRRIVIPPAWQDVWICPDPARPHPGRRHRRRGATPVPLPRRVDPAARRGEVRPRRAPRPRHRRRPRPRSTPASPAARASDATACSPARCGCSTSASSGSAARSTPTRTRPATRSFGLATLRREHAVARRDGGVEFRYIAKSGVPRRLTLHDEHIHGWSAR